MNYNKLNCLLILILILCSDFSLIAYAQEQPTAGQILQEYADTPAPTQEEPEFSCDTKKISQQEANNIRELLMGDNDEDGNPIDGTAFVGKESRSQTADELDSNKEGPKEPRKQLSQNKIVVSSDDANKAVRLEIQDQIMKPHELSHITNTTITGKFEFGFVLDDTLRAGRCLPPRDQTTIIDRQGETNSVKPEDVQNLRTQDLGPFSHLYESEQEKKRQIGDMYQLVDENATATTSNTYSCYTRFPNTKYRNSGDGIIKGVGNVVKDFKKYLDGDKPTAGLTDEQRQNLKDKVDVEQEDQDLTYTKVIKLESDPIKNVIEADRFEAKIGTNCLPGLCVISSYSQFDKYFNSWFSATMVASTFAPTLLGRAKKFFNMASNRGLMFRLEDTKLWQWMYKWKVFAPDSWLNRLKLQRLRSRVREYGLHEDFYRPLMNFDPKAPGQGFWMLTTDGFENWWGQQMAKGGLLDNITSAQQRKALIQTVKDLKTWFYSAEAYRNAAEETFKNAVKQFGQNSSQARAALVDYGKAVGKLGINLDDMVGCDWFAYWARTNQNFAFKYHAVEDVGTGTYRTFLEEHRNLRDVTRKFIKDGDWRNWNAGEFDNTIFRTIDDFGVDTGNIKLFKAGVKGQPTGEISVDDLASEIAKGNITQKFTFLENGEIVPVKAETADLITRESAGTVQLYDGGWQHVAGDADYVLTPERLANDFTNSRNKIYNTIIGKNNANIMWENLQAKGWINTKYYNVLDKALKDEEHLVKAYFSLKGGAKWTALPFAYNWVKRGGGLEGASAYMLPDTWKNIKTVIGEDEIYDDAYVDFFANEGSDMGDIFMAVLNKLPWKYVLDEVSKRWNPVRKIYDMLSGNEYRKKVDNLTMFMGIVGQNCAGCTITVNSEGLKDFKPSYFSPQGTKSYFLEEIHDEKNKELGRTIIVFTHHTDLVGETGKENPVDQPDGIQLSKAIKEKETCADKVNETELGIVTRNLGIFEKQRIGLLMGTAEMMAFGIFGWSGIFFSVAQQLVIAPKLQDCVDTDEGYYIHYFLPNKEEKMKEKMGIEGELTAENLMANLQKGMTTAMDQVTIPGDKNSTAVMTMEQLKEEAENFITQGLQEEIVQAQLFTQGSSTGGLQSKEITYFWYDAKAEKRPSNYREEGKEVLVDDMSGKEVVMDFEQGKVTVNGKDVVTEPDLVRMTFTDNKIPAQVIPETITAITIPDDGQPLFEITPRGDTMVLHENILTCIQAGVKEQTGLELKTNNLADAFEDVQNIVTSTHPTIKPIKGEKAGFLAQGIPTKSANGSDSRIKIDTGMNVELYQSSDGQPELGQLRSIQLRNGNIVFNPKTKQLLIHLRHHKDGTINQQDVKGLKSELTTIKNEETGCDEPAINFEVAGEPQSPRSMAAAEQFNKAIAAQGPFQTFETEDKRYIIYSDEDCKDHLRVIDKKTGKIEDYAGTITKTPTGLKITTDDGEEHTLDFSAKDGVPQVSFDGAPPETLRAAQGPNGSFYYDPETGQWYAENGQLLPLLEAFKQNGTSTTVNANGDVTSSAAGNILNVYSGKEGGLQDILNLPSLPTNPLMLTIFIVSLLGIFLHLQLSIKKKK